MNISDHESPAAEVMSEAVEMAIEERSPYPDRAAFINADSRGIGAAIRRALDEDMAIVLVFPDRTTRTLYAEPASR
jgi:hypothetical protein